jgi:hypothetical protein
MGEAKHALLGIWSDRANLGIPEELVGSDEEEANSFSRATDCFVIEGVCPRSFERLECLRRTGVFCFDRGRRATHGSLGLSACGHFI